MNQRALLWVRHGFRSSARPLRKGLRRLPLTNSNCGIAKKCEHFELSRAQDTGRRKSDNRPRRIRMKHCHVSTWYSFSTKKLPHPRTFLAVEMKDLRYERTEIKEDNIPQNRRWKCCYHENPGYLLPTKHSGLTTEDSITARALAWYVGISRRHGDARNTGESRYP